MNETFQQVIASVRKVDEKNEKPYFLMTYKWTDGVEKEFIESRHGNAKKPHAPIYNRQDPITKVVITEKLSSGSSCGKAYRDAIQEANVSS